MKVTERLDSGGLLLKQVFGIIEMDDSDSVIVARSQGNFEKLKSWI